MDFLITVILIILLIYFVGRAALRVYLRRAASRAANNTAYRRNSKRGNVAYQDDKTTVISHGEERSEVPTDFGEYTDFEEVKEE